MNSDFHFELTDALKDKDRAERKLRMLLARLKVFHEDLCEQIDLAKPNLPLTQEIRIYKKLKLFVQLLIKEAEA